MKQQSPLPVPVSGAKPSDLQHELQSLLIARVKMPHLAQSLRQTGEQQLQDETAKLTRALGAELAAMKPPLDRSTGDRIVERVKNLNTLDQQNRDRMQAMHDVAGLIQKRIDFLRAQDPQAVLDVLQARCDQLNEARKTQQEGIGLLDDEIKAITLELEQVRKLLKSPPAAAAGTEGEVPAEKTPRAK